MEMNPEMKIVIIRHGPYEVRGGIPLERELIVCDRSGIPVEWQKGKRYPVRDKYRLCRCGRSSAKPYCDGTHTETGFDGTETASREPYFEAADLIDGPGIDLADLPSLCVEAKFCHRAQDVWRLAATSSDPESIELAIRNASDCPSGRLVAMNKATRKPIEPGFEPSISVIEMPAARLSGPLWVKGGVPIEAAGGWTYEIRNRVTLCRCGASRNKPFCDGTHYDTGFNDGDETVRR